MHQSKQTLEKTEEAIKKGQFRDTGNFWHTRHRTKTNKKKHKMLKYEQQEPHQAHGVNTEARER